MMLLNYGSGGKESYQRNFAESETKHFVRSQNKMQYFGHVMRAHQSLEKNIMLRITAGTRERMEASYAVDGRYQKCNWTLSK